MKMLNLSSIFFLVLMHIIPHSKAQTAPDSTIKEKTQFLMQRRIEFSNTSEKQELTIKVNMQNCMFDLEIKSSVNNGELEVEIYDPTGKKQGSFSVGCQINTQSNNMNKTKINDFFNGKTTSKNTQANNEEAIVMPDKKNELNESVSGRTSKSIKNPILGDWTIKFSPTNASGYIIVASRQVLSEK